MNDPEQGQAEREAEDRARREVLDTALAMSRKGLSPGKSGNASRRFRDGMLITPSGQTYASMLPADIVFVADDGSVGPGQKKPSTEWRFHLMTYRSRADVGGIVHTHSPYATALACAGKSIPAFHYMVAVAGAMTFRSCPTATFGTKELARHVAKGLRRRDACLMANHGQIAVGDTCREALDLAAEIENLAEQYCKVLSLGDPIVLPDEEMERVLQSFAGYGERQDD
ncbi:MAG: class II aldolase [Sphingomonadales bacterium]|nr:class II aldolase [Sphingomonadales bacterium]